MNTRHFAFLFLVVLPLFFCDTSTQPESSSGSIQGTVQNSGNNQPVAEAFVFLQDSLITETDATGSFEISMLEQGSYSLTVSALNFSDRLVDVQVQGGKTADLTVSLEPDTTTGRVYAEFQDLSLFREQLNTTPSMSDWTAHELFDGVTGATLQSKTLRRELPQRSILLKNSQVGISDDFGQSWFEIQSGTYPLTGSCEGYSDSTTIVHVPANGRAYVIFYMQPIHNH